MKLCPTNVVYKFYVNKLVRFYPTKLPSSSASKYFVQPTELKGYRVRELKRFC